MTKASSSRLRLIFALVALAATPAGATTYVLPTDQVLLEQATLVVEAEIVAQLPGITGTAPAVDSLAVVHRVIKGKARGTVIVRTAGGPTGDGLHLVLEGGVDLHAGDATLLFLSPNPDGTFSPLHSALGVFHRRTARDRVVAERKLGSSRLLTLELEPAIDPPRDYESFVRWLEDGAEGRVRPTDYRLPANRTPPPKYVLTTVDGRNVRWFEFDSGGNVRWRFRAAGSGNTLSAFRSGLGAWNGAGTPVDLVYGGTTGATGGFTTSDRVNAVLFGDPNNMVPGTFQCGQGGILAIGGFWHTSATGTFEGQRYVRILEGDVVVNDGTNCLIDNNARAAAEIFTHELGHTLGIGHSENRDATMFATLHNDGRGATLRTDDKNAVKRLYGHDDGGGSPNPPPPAAGPKAPSNLQAWAISATKLRLRWKDNSRDETAFEVWRRIVGRNWSLWRTEAANAQVVVATDAKPQTTYEFRVRARRGGEASVYSNTATLEMPAGLDAPRNLRARALSPTEVALRWRDASSSELKFQLWVRPAGEDWRLAETLAANTTRATYSRAQPGATYEFRVRAKRGSRFGDFSKVAEVTLPVG